MYGTQLFFRGRKDRAINRGGILIPPEPIEECLMRHPAIQTCRVDRESHPFWGEVPVATVYLNPGMSAPDSEVLRRFCAERLRPAEIPSRIIIQSGEAPAMPKEVRLLAMFRP